MAETMTTEKTPEVFLQLLNQDSLGKSISSALLPRLRKGKYALVKKKNGNSKVLVYTPSRGTSFYNDTKVNLNIPYDEIKESGLLPTYHVERNASPAGSDSQQYEEGLLFEI